MALVSYIIPMYNAAITIREAVESLVGQTFPDIEIVVVDDGSTDGSSTVVQGIPDARIRIVSLPHNMGKTAALNRGIQEVVTQFVARMDADDVALPERTAQQLRAFGRVPGLAVLGGSVELFGARQGIWEYPETHEGIAVELLGRCALAHPTVMFNLRNVDRGELRYLPEFDFAEDYELWVRLKQRCRFQNLRQPLVRYRCHPQQDSQTHQQRQMELSRSIRERQALAVLPDASLQDLETHEVILAGGCTADRRLARRAAIWTVRFFREAMAKSLYAPSALRAFLLPRLRNLCFSEAGPDLVALRAYARADACLGGCRISRHTAKLFLRSVRSAFGDQQV